MDRRALAACTVGQWLIDGWALGLAIEAIDLRPFRLAANSSYYQYAPTSRLDDQDDVWGPTVGPGCVADAEPGSVDLGSFMAHFVTFCSTCGQ